MVRVLLMALVAAVVFAACGEGDAPDASAPAQTRTEPGTGDRFPDIVSAELVREGADVFSAAVEVSSPYDSPDRYADGWRVLADGSDEVLGTHMLGHDHAAEQPFTRTQSGLEIPGDVARVRIEGHDLANGYGGETVTVDVPR